MPQRLVALEIVVHAINQLMLSGVPGHLEFDMLGLQFHIEQLLCFSG